MRKSLMGLVVLQLFLVSCKSKSSLELYELYHFDTPGWAHDVAFDGSDIYVADRQAGFAIFEASNGFRRIHHALPLRDIISLSPNSGRPVLAAGYEGLVLVSPDGGILDRCTCGEIVNSVVVRRDYVFAACGSRGLFVARLAEGRIRMVADLPTQGWSHSLLISGDQALMADWNKGLRIVDIRNPDKPEEICFLPGPATCISVAVREWSGKRMLALAEGHGGVALVQLDPEGRPKLMGRNYLGLNPKDSILPKAGGWAHSVAWAGRFLFTANWKRGLAVLDTLDPHNPLLIREIATPGTALGVKARLQSDGSYLVFLAAGESGLRIFRFRY